MDAAALEIYFIAQWDAIISRHRLSLDADDLETINHYNSWDSIQSNIFNDVPQSISYIQPALEHLNVFTGFFNTKLATSLDSTFLWGALGCLLQLLADSEDSEVLVKLPGMVKQLVLQAEAFNELCDSTINPVKEACFDMQVLYLEFHTSCIRSLHDGDDCPVQLIEKRFASTKQDLKEALDRIREFIQSRSLRIQSQSSTSGVNLPPKFRCLMQPDSRTTHLFDRVAIFESLDRILAPTETRSFKSVALYGIGGVGKSTVAANYLTRKYDDKSYDVLLWAYGEKSASLRQSFTDIALRLKIPEARPQAHDDNLILVHDWFQSTDSQRLIVYDNVNDANTVMPYWPRSSKGYGGFTLLLL